MDHREPDHQDPHDGDGDEHLPAQAHAPIVTVAGKGGQEPEKSGTHFSF